MLENLLFSLNVVLPVFIMITLGFLGVRFGVVDRETMNKLSRITFNWFLSVKIFLSTYDAPLEELAGLTMAWYCCVAQVVIFVLAWLVAPRIVRRRESVGAFVHCSFRGSITVLGLALVNNLAGDAGVAICAPLVALCSVENNILAVTCLTHHDRGVSRGKMILSSAVKILKNPLVLGAGLGFLANWLKLPCPELIRSPMEYLSDLAEHLSLLGIGAALDLGRVRNSLPDAAWAAVFKTFISGALALPPAVLLGFRGTELAIIGFVFTLANPSACYVMTAAMDGDGELAASATVLSTILSIFSVTLMLYLLRQLGLL